MKPIIVSHWRAWAAAALSSALACGAMAGAPQPATPLEVRIEVLDPDGGPAGWFDPGRQLAFRLGFVAGAIYGPVAKRVLEIEGERGRRVEVDLGTLAREAEASAATLRPDLKEKGLRVEPEETRFVRISSAAHVVGVEAVNVSGYFAMNYRGRLYLAWFDRPCRISGQVETGTSVTDYAIEIKEAGLHWIWEEYLEDKRYRLRDVEMAGDLRLAARLGSQTKNDTKLDSPVKKIQAPAPAYPEALRRLSIQGEVVTWAYVDAKGEVYAVVVRRSNDDVFSRATIPALSQWRFIPATRGGQPTSFIGEFTFTFKLKN